MEIDSTARTRCLAFKKVHGPQWMPLSQVVAFGLMSEGAPHPLPEISYSTGTKWWESLDVGFTTQAPFFCRPACWCILRRGPDVSRDAALVVGVQSLTCRRQGVEAGWHWPMWKPSSLVVVVTCCPVLWHISTAMKHITEPEFLCVRRYMCMPRQLLLHAIVVASGCP